MALTKSLKFKLAVFFSLLALAPTLLVGLFTYSVLQNSLLDAAKTNARDMVSTQMSNFDLTASSIELALNELALAETTQAYIQLRYDKQSEAYYRSLLLLSTKMDTLMNQRGDSIRAAAILWNDGEMPFVRGDSASLRLYGDYRENFPFSAIEQSAAAIRWEQMLDERGNPQIFVYKPIYSVSGESAGIIVFQFYNDFIENLFHIPSEPGSFGILLDGGSNVITAPQMESDELAEILEAILENMPENTKNSVFFIDRKSNPFLVAAASSNVNSWQYILCNPLENIRKSTGTITLVVILAILCAATGAVLAGMLLYRYINRPIQKLAAAMKKFQRGDFSTRVENSRTDELGLLSDGFNRMAEQTLLLIDNIKLEQEKKRETEIRFLQAQISPHFLYNTLNTSKVLARQGRTKDVSDMITSLISLLRLTSNGDERITLEQELAYVKNYISIMEYRKDQKFNLFIKIADDAANCLIPKFTLQPIVENSIIHGFNGKTGNLELHITAENRNGVLSICLSDNGVGFSILEQSADVDSDARFKKVGTYNVDERLKLYYGPEYGLTVESEPGAGTNTTLRLPAAYNKMREKDISS